MKNQIKPNNDDIIEFDKDNQIDLSNKDKNLRLDGVFSFKFVLYLMKKYYTKKVLIYFQRYTRYLLICLTLASIGAGFQVGLSVAIFNTPTQVKQNKKNHLI